MESGQPLGGTRLHCNMTARRAIPVTMEDMEFFRRATRGGRRIGILSGSFHPPTRAHLALATGALNQVDEVIFVLPRVFPHKAYERVGFEDRLSLLLEATKDEPRFSVATTEGGLFIEIAREYRKAANFDADLWFLCGRDAAERIVNWDYGEPGTFRKMLLEFGLLVADRDGRYTPPVEMRDRILRLALPDNYDAVSATEVRERIQRGEHWRELVPVAIVAMVEEVYQR